MTVSPFVNIVSKQLRKRKGSKTSMEDMASLRQTVTHLFDAVRHGKHARELEEDARSTENNLEADLSKLESHTEELSNLLSSMKDDSEEAIRDLSRQLQEFLTTAREQAKAKLERKAKDDLQKNMAAAAAERDRAIKSLEAYLASDPLPLIDSSVSLRLVEGAYAAQAAYECDRGMRYEFGLGTQNSMLFHQEFSLSQVADELRVPVRFSRTLLKGRVPGFERLDQYVLADAELSNGKIRANFQKVGNGAKIKVVMSGFEPKDFVALEFSDQSGTVNVTNDLSLVAHADLKLLKSALAELAKDMTELSSKKVSLLRLTLGDEDLLASLDCYRVLEVVMDVLGPKYRSLLERMPESQPPGKPESDMSLLFVRDRLRILGELSKPVSQLLGVKDRGLLSRP